MGALNLGAFSFIDQKFVHFGCGAIIHNDRVSMVVHVEDEVLAHDGQSDETDVSLWCYVLHVVV